MAKTSAFYPTSAPKSERVPRREDTRGATAGNHCRQDPARVACSLRLRVVPAAHRMRERR